jgi:hemoglobin
METTTEKSLYERLGGADGIAVLVDDIIEAHMRNPEIKARYLPSKDDPVHFEKVKKHLRDFLGAGTGGPETYEGKDMPSAHRGMNISEGEYMHVLDDILWALDNNNIDPATKNEVLGIAYSLKGDIVRL